VLEEEEEVMMMMIAQLQVCGWYVWEATRGCSTTYHPWTYLQVVGGPVRSTSCKMLLLVEVVAAMATQWLS